MTLLNERQEHGIHPVFHPSRTITESVAGVIGALAAGLGAWMYYAADNVLWFWNTAEFAIDWSLGLLVAGGLIMTAAFGIAANKVFRDDWRMSARAYMNAALGFIGLAVAVTFALIWIL